MITPRSTSPASSKPFLLVLAFFCRLRQTQLNIQSRPSSVTADEEGHFWEVRMNLAVVVRNDLVMVFSLQAPFRDAEQGLIGQALSYQ